jgi:hypothetical protein
VPLYIEEYSQPGRYTVIIPVSPPEAMTLVLSMVNEHGQRYEDAVSVHIATRFYIWLKYLIVVPVILLVLPLLAIDTPMQHNMAQAQAKKGTR